MQGDSEGQGIPACCSPWGHKQTPLNDWTTSVKMAFLCATMARSLLGVAKCQDMAETVTCLDFILFHGAYSGSGKSRMTSSHFLLVSGLGWQNNWQLTSIAFFSYILFPWTFFNSSLKWRSQVVQFLVKRQEVKQQILKARVYKLVKLKLSCSLLVK